MTSDSGFIVRLQKRLRELVHLKCRVRKSLMERDLQSGLHDLVVIHIQSYVDQA